jgi:hypothetical protein
MITNVSEEYSTSIFRDEENQVGKMTNYTEEGKNVTDGGRKEWPIIIMNSGDL